jgi:superfamily II DNA/RNA helicase
LTDFSDFGLAEPITRALAAARYLTPTPIQTQTIPLALAGRDIVGIAQTGTGKTAAFALPILNRLATDKRRPDKRACRVLVLSPTRELSGQIVASFKSYGRNLRLSSALAIGGVPIGRQRNTIAMGVDILVATPGRLLDLVNSRMLRLDQVEVLVLDEADRMLDMGFIHDIRKIVTFLPKERQTLFFSATMPAEIADLAGRMLTNPARVAVTPAATTVERVVQRVVHVEKTAKPSVLARLLADATIDRALIFTRTKHGADRVVRGLIQAGISAQAIHGNKSQPQRERTLAAFRSGAVRTLVATDIAARGIDVTGISHVINFDLPNLPESYVHRIGRTARAGRQGVAISLVSADEVEFLRDIEKLIRIEIPASGEAPRVGAAKPRNEHAGRRASNGHRANGHRSKGEKAAPAGPHGQKAASGDPGNRPQRRRFFKRSKPGSQFRQLTKAIAVNAR